MHSIFIYLKQAAYLIYHLKDRYNDMSRWISILKKNCLNHDPDKAVPHHQIYDIRIRKSEECHRTAKRGKPSRRRENDETEKAEYRSPE